MRPARASAGVATSMQALVDAVWALRDSDGGLPGFAYGARVAAENTRDVMPAAEPVWLAFAELIDNLHHLRSEAAVTAAVDQAMAHLDTT